MTVLSPDQITVPVGNQLWVDFVNGVDLSAVRGRIERPFKTIQAAIDAAVAGDLVLVGPGIYSEVITCKNGVSVHGADAHNCVISRSAGSAETVVTMAEDMEFSDFYMALSPSAGLTTGIVMPATTNVSSFIARVVQELAPTGTGTVRGLLVSGTGVAEEDKHPTADGCLFAGDGSFAVEITGVGGTTVIRGCNIAGNAGTGLKVTAGTLHSHQNQCSGDTFGIAIAVGATLVIDSVTTFTDIENLGTLTNDTFVYVRDNLTAIVDPTLNDDQIKGFGTGSQWLNTATSTLYVCIDPAVGAAVWTFVQTSSTPAGTLTPGEHLLGGLLDYGASGGQTVGEVQYVQVFMSAATTLVNMRCYVDTGGSNSRNIRMGIYAQADAQLKSGVPVTMVAQTDSTATTGADGTFLTVALTASYLVPITGYYWIAFVTDNSAAIKFAVSPTVYRAGFLPVRRQSGSGTTLPATVGTITNPSSAITYVAAVE